MNSTIVSNPCHEVDICINALGPIIFRQNCKMLRSRIGKQTWISALEKDSQLMLLQTFRGISGRTFIIYNSVFSKPYLKLKRHQCQKVQESGVVLYLVKLKQVVVFQLQCPRRFAFQHLKIFAWAGVFIQKCIRLNSFYSAYVFQETPKSNFVKIAKTLLKRNLHRR